MDKFIKDVILKLKAINDGGDFSEDTILSIMVLIRQHLEAKDLKKEYKTTNLYCDWCVHTRLDRNSEVKDFFHQISVALSEHQGEDINDMISKALSFHTLRKELIKITNVAGVRWVLFGSYEGWKTFSRILVKILLEKPFINMNNMKSPNTDWLISEFRFKVPDLSGVDENFRTQNQGTVFWEASFSPQETKLTGALILTESKNDFGK